MVGIGSSGRLGVVSYEGQYDSGLLEAFLDSRMIHLIESFRAQVFLVHTPELCGRGSPCDGQFHNAFLERYNENSRSATTGAHYRRIPAAERPFPGPYERGH